MMYFAFALIPILTLVSAFFPELTGKCEAIPADGFEYSICLPKKWLILGGFGISAFGILFLLSFDNPNSPIFGALPVYAILFFAMLGEVVSLFSVIFYFGYRLTVRGGVIFYKLPLRRELTVPISELDQYEAVKRKNGRLTLRMFHGKRVLFAQGAKTEILLCELESRNIKKKER